MNEKKNYQTIDEYIAEFPAAVQEILQKIRQTIAEAAPHAIETINYQIPTFKLNGTNLVHFGGYKRHIGFYPASGAIEKFKSELAGYAGAKGSVQFPLDQPMPLELIDKIVKFRVEDILTKSKSKPVKQK